jgi:hypothetical protein
MKSMNGYESGLTFGGPDLDISPPAVGDTGMVLGYVWISGLGLCICRVVSS